MSVQQIYEDPGSRSIYPREGWGFQRLSRVSVLINEGGVVCGAGW